MHRASRRRTLATAIVTFCLSVAADKPLRTTVGNVIAVADGDTITILDSDQTKHKVRLRGIDAPEIGHGKKSPGQPFGTRARQLMHELVMDRHVLVRWAELDRYGRILGDVYVQEDSETEAWINRTMVEAGLAWHYKKYDKRRSVADAEWTAREAKRGLWAEPNPTPPWEWRNPSTQPNRP